jgi:alcohol dehydrogenase (NADP+)
MSSDVKFEGWAGMDEHACEGKLEFQSFTPKRWDEDDVDGEDLSLMECFQMIK